MTSKKLVTGRDVNTSPSPQNNGNSDGSHYAELSIEVLLVLLAFLLMSLAIVLLAQAIPSLFI